MSFKYRSVCGHWENTSLVEIYVHSSNRDLTITVTIFIVSIVEYFARNFYLSACLSFLTVIFLNIKNKIMIIKIIY